MSEQETPAAPEAPAAPEINANMSDEAIVEAALAGVPDEVGSEPVAEPPPGNPKANPEGIKGDPDDSQREVSGEVKEAAEEIEAQGDSSVEGEAAPDADTPADTEAEGDPALERTFAAVARREAKAREMEKQAREAMASLETYKQQWKIQNDAIIKMQN